MWNLEEATIQKDLVKKLLSKLKEKDIIKYQVVILSVLENKKYVDIATELGISKNMVSRHLYKGLRIMSDHSEFNLRVKSYTT